MRAIFSRDLAFTGLEPKDRPFDWVKPDLKPERTWNVVGIYDFLRFGEPARLDSISEVDVERASKHQSHIAIFPFAGELTPPDDFLQILQMKADPNVLADHPFLVFCAIHFSSAIYEGNEQGAVVLKSMRNFMSLWNGLPQRPLTNTHFYGCLSNPDLVLLSLPRSPEELCRLYKTIRAAQCLTVEQVLTGEGAPPRSDRSPSDPEPGHACMSIQPFFAFQPGATPVIHTPEFRRAERDLDLHYRFRLRVRCGHEGQVVEELSGGTKTKDPLPALPHEDAIRFRLNSDGKAPDAPPPGETDFEITWDQHGLRGHFLHFSAFKHVWDKKWFDEDWRRLHLLNSHSALVTPEDGNPVNNWNHNRLAWDIAPAVLEQLQRLYERIDNFAGTILNATMRLELLSMLSSYYACFFRQDLMGAARDLFPFFRQLGLLFDDPESWREYLHCEDQETALKRSRDFQDDLRDLFVHANRAIRNRLEHRSTIGDPPFPTTFREGTSKTIGAYSAIVFLCWEIFHRPPTAPQIKLTDKADRFAACIHSGIEGRVICTELFKGYRQHRLAQLLPAEREPFETQLLVFDFSGRSLLRPEHFIVQSLHEVAEFSNWLMAPGNRLLRLTINEAISQSVNSIFKHLFSKSVLGLGGRETPPDAPSLRETKRDYLLFCTDFIDLCLAHAHATDEQWQALDQNGIGRINGDLLEGTDPMDCVRLYRDALWQAKGTRSLMQKLGLVYGTTAREERTPLRPPEAEHVFDFLSQDLLFAALESEDRYLNEVLADIGMWCGLYNLLTRTLPDHLQRCHIPEDERQRHVNKIFNGILQQAHDSGAGNNPDRGLIRHIIQRWKVHFLAVSQPAEGLSRQFREVLRAASEEFPVLTDERLTQEIETPPAVRGSALDWIIEKLRDFVPYGGTIEISMGHPPSEKKDIILEVFDRLWSSPTPATSDRIDLIMKLWSCSSHFAIGQLIVPTGEHP